MGTSLVTDVSDTSDASDINQNQTRKGNSENQSQSDNFCNDGSNSKIKKILIETEKNLETITKIIDSETFDKLVNQLELSLLKQLKQALKQLKINESTLMDNNSNINNENEKQTDMNEYYEHKSNTYNLNINDSSVLGDGDNATVISVATDLTGVTGVSSIAAPISMNDPLIVMIGIGKYDGMANLDGVSKDYDNIIDTFVKYWKYKIFYKSNNTKQYIYTNNIDEIKTNYKLEWNGDEIDSFIEESRKFLVKNRHDGLMFAISSHGDRDKVLYDSECEQYALDSIFSMYSAQASALLESYSETQEESNHLLSENFFSRYVSW